MPNIARVAFANTEADQTLACPAAKNTVAKEIKNVVDAYRAANPSLEYIVLAGGADVIPFFQVQDVSGLADEKDYVPPVAPSTASEAGLKTNLVQGTGWLRLTGGIHPSRAHTGSPRSGSWTFGGYRQRHQRRGGRLYSDG